MLDSSTFRRSLVALALCSTAFAASATPAAARSYHGSRRQAHFHDIGHHARRHFATRHFRHLAHRSRWDESVAALRTSRLRNAYASVGPDEFSGGASMQSGFGSSGAGSSELVSEARHYLWRNLLCPLPECLSHRFFECANSHDGIDG